MAIQLNRIRWSEFNLVQCNTAWTRFNFWSTFSWTEIMNDIGARRPKFFHDWAELLTHSMDIWELVDVLRYLSVYHNHGSDMVQGPHRKHTYNINDNHKQLNTGSMWTGNFQQTEQMEDNLPSYWTQVKSEQRDSRSQDQHDIADERRGCHGYETTNHWSDPLRHLLCRRGKV